MPRVTVLVGPNVYGGDGSETRVNLVLRASPNALAPSLVEKVRSIEANLLGADSVKTCNSAIISEDTIKSKLALDSVNVFDAQHAAIDVPTPAQWKGRIVNARLEIRGAWQSRLGAGLSIVCTDVQFLTDSSDATPPAASPFMDIATSGTAC